MKTTIANGMLAAATLALGSAAAYAQPHASDILLDASTGTIRTGAFEPGIGPLFPARLFVAELGTAFPNFTADPGFDCAPGTFNPTTSIGFRIHGPLLRWDGSAFPPVAGGEMLIEFITLSAQTPTIDTTVTGFTLRVGSNGQWHRHLDYTLLPPADNGVYLLELTLFHTGPLLESEPFWILFDQNASTTELDAAAVWVEDNLINPQPQCPADWDASGGVDGDDIAAFFADWQAGDADIDESGCTDGDDIAYFFTRWQAGC